MAFATFAPERQVTTLGLALCLRDALTLESELRGSVSVTAGAIVGWPKPGTGTYLFFDLPVGATSFAVRSDPATPYYRATDIVATLPTTSPLSPAWPDPALADPAKSLFDTTQPDAYRAQFEDCALMPTVAYPFDPAATLLRGTVTSGGVPVADATVRDVGGDALPYLTDADGEYVLPFLSSAAGTSSVTVRVSRSAHPDVDTPATLRRGATTVLQISV